MKKRSTLISVISLPLFIILATANGAGYRYGVSDQAFYIPAIVHAANPETFPRDRALIEPQSRLLILDGALGALKRATVVPLPVLFAAGYVLSLILIWSALLLIGRTLYVHQWTTIALLAAFTLRHQITRTSANSFEPYFHPRMLAFAVCALGVAAFLRRRSWIAIALVAAGGLIHPTTAIWFALLIGVALIVSEHGMRPVLAVAVGLAIAIGGWAMTIGPLSGSLVRMDDEWRQALVSKTSLFANEWPATAWLANLGTLAVWACVYIDRRRRGIATPEDTGLLAGGGVLLAMFLVTLPLVAAGVFLFVELQMSRVFWLIDFLATIYALALVDRLGVTFRQTVALVLVAFSVARGAYALLVERPERSLFSFHLEDSPWHDAMRWLASQPIDVHVLADPGHAWKYGTSVRVSAGRDVFQEDVKDSAMAIYSRDVAMRVLERGRAIGDFDAMTPARAIDLANQYGLDYLVTTQKLELPAVYRNREFTIYELR